MDSALLDVHAGHCSWLASGEHDRPASTGLPASMAWWLFNTVCGRVPATALQHLPLQQGMY